MSNTFEYNWCALFKNYIIFSIAHFALREGILVKMRFQVLPLWYWITIGHKFLVDDDKIKRINYIKSSIPKLWTSPIFVHNFLPMGNKFGISHLWYFFYCVVSPSNVFWVYMKYCWLDTWRIECGFFYWIKFRSHICIRIRNNSIKWNY